MQVKKCGKKRREGGCWQRVERYWQNQTCLFCWVCTWRIKWALTTQPPSSAEVKNEWSYTSAPPIYLLDVDRDMSYWCLKRAEFIIEESRWIRTVLKVMFVAYQLHSQCIIFRTTVAGAPLSFAHRSNRCAFQIIWTKLTALTPEGWVVICYTPIPSLYRTVNTFRSGYKTQL